MTQTSHPLRIGIIGTGRVAQALAFALRGRGQGVWMWGRSAPALAHAARRCDAVAAADPGEIVAACAVVLIAVADAAITSVVAAITRYRPEDSPPLVAHVSGASGIGILEPLRAWGAQTAAIHPAMTFTGDPVAETARMAGARFAITGSDRAAMAHARALVDLLGGVTVEIDEGDRALYHAALCHAANHLVTLMAGSDAMLRAAGVEDPQALLAPLVRAALDNSANHGFAALSGPVLRGDAETVDGHMKALAQRCPQALPAYRAMALATLDELDSRRQTADAAMRAVLV